MALHWIRQEADGTLHKLLQMWTTLMTEGFKQIHPGGIGLHLNADKMEYQRGDISTLYGGSLKLVDKFTNLGSIVSSTENDINIWLAKAWTAINRLSVIWKSDLSNEIKCNFVPSSCCVHTTVWMHYLDAD